MPFAPQADLLGVRLDASGPQRAVVKVSNKPERAREIAASIDNVLEAGRVDSRLIPLFFGRTQFSEAQLLGRQGKLALARLSWMANAYCVHTLDVCEVKSR